MSEYKRKTGYFKPSASTTNPQKILIILLSPQNVALRVFRLDQTEFELPSLIESLLFLEKFLVIAWTIWTERNKVIHGASPRGSSFLAQWALNYYEESSSTKQKDVPNPIQPNVVRSPH